MPALEKLPMPLFLPKRPFPSRRTPFIADDREEVAPALQSATNFIAHYFAQRRIHFMLLVLMVAGAAGCAVGVQYVMRQRPATGAH